MKAAPLPAGLPSAPALPLLSGAAAGLALLALSACLPAGGGGPVTCYFDGDEDGWGTTATFDLPQGPCSNARGAAEQPGDCDDGADWIHPGANDLPDDGFDADCEGGDRVTCYVDGDADGFGGEAVIVDRDECQFEFGYSVVSGDCDDGDSYVWPSAPEVPDDGVDQDCNGSDAVTCWFDGDGDGHGFVDSFLIADGVCGDDPSEVGSGLDCDDDNADIHPDATELCNGFDDDCDSLIDAGQEHAHPTATNSRLRFPELELGWGAFTIELRLRVWNPELGAGRPLFRVESAGGETELRLDNDADGNWLVHIAGLPTPLEGPPIPSGAVHFALVSDEQQLLLYADGLQVWSDVVAAPSSWTQASGWTWLGDDGGNALLVDMDELRFWDAALSAEELLDRHCRSVNATAAPLLSNIRGVLPFDGSFQDIAGQGNSAVAEGDWSFEPYGLQD